MVLTMEAIMAISMEKMRGRVMLTRMDLIMVHSTVILMDKITVQIIVIQMVTIMEF